MEKSEENFKYIAKNSKNADERLEAIKRIKDQSFLEWFIYKEPFWRISLDAIKEIYDQDILKRIVYNSKYPTIRYKALDKISNQNIISDIIFSDLDWKIRAQALSKISKNNKILRKVALYDKNKFFRAYALEITKSIDMVEESIKKEKDFYVKNIADIKIEQLKNHCIN